MSRKRKHSIEEIRAFAKSHNLREIAAYMDITRATARVCVSDYDIQYIKEYTKIQHTACRYEEIVDYIEKGHSGAETAKEFGVSTNTVSNARKFIGLKRLKKDGSEVRPVNRNGTRDDMIKTLSETYSLESIGKVFGFSREWIRQIADKKS